MVLTTTTAELYLEPLEVCFILDNLHKDLRINHIYINPRYKTIRLSQRSKVD